MLPGIVEFIHKDMTFCGNTVTKQELPPYLTLTYRYLDSPILPVTQCHKRTFILRMASLNRGVILGVSAESLIYFLFPLTSIQHINP